MALQEFPSMVDGSDAGAWSKEVVVSTSLQEQPPEGFNLLKLIDGAVAQGMTSIFKDITS